MQKIALITGATRGLGFATARQLGDAGVKPIVGARDPDSGARAVEQLRAGQIEAETVVLDVTSVTSVRAAAEQLRERHGRLDILVNNAGILPEATEGEGDGELDLELFRKTFETNLFGAVSMVQEFLPLLRRSEAGRIVNVSSTMGSLTDQLDPDSPYYGVITPAYQGSKAALNGLTVALAKLLDETPIKVNSICPGWLKTDLGGPDNRAVAPTSVDEGARIVVEMASVGADGPSGQFVDRDGAVPW
jgi:NAD(P)-dependent dehydrogenase (short-subunit alcohol dehydrogenase family)